MDSSDIDGATSYRPDGTARAPLKRPRDGYQPPDEIARYVAPRPQRYRGAVLQWSAVKGYGFIRPDDLGPNVFAHRTDLIGTHELQFGDVVEFDLRRAVPGENADRAINIMRMHGAAAAAATDMAAEPAAASWPPSANAGPAIEGVRHARPAALQLVPRSVAARMGKQSGGPSVVMPRPKPSAEAAVLGLWL